MHAVGRAGLVGQARRTGPIDDRNPVFLLGHLRDAERDGGIDQIGNHVDVFDIKPFARDSGSDVRLVLVIRDDQFDRLAENLAAEILDRHADCGDRAFSGFVGKLTGHIGQHADLHDVIRYGTRLRSRAANARNHRRRNKKRTANSSPHVVPSRGNPKTNRSGGLDAHLVVTCITRLKFFCLSIGLMV